MPRSLALFAAMLFGGSILAGARPERTPVPAGFAAGPRAVTEWLDLYLAAQFDAVMSAVDQESDYDRVLDDLKKSGPAWWASGSPDARDRRELAAATFALEAARLDEWNEWKTRILLPPGAEDHHGDIVLTFDVGAACFEATRNERPVLYRRRSTGANTHVAPVSHVFLVS